MKKYFLLLIASLSVSVFADEHGHDEHEETAKEEGIVLTEQAAKNFGIKVQKIIPDNHKAEIPISAVVNSEDKKQIFIFQEGKYEIRNVNVVKRTSSSVVVDGFSGVEDVVVSGVNFLKVVEMSQDEDDGGGHSD